MIRLEIGNAHLGIAGKQIGFSSSVAFTNSLNAFVKLNDVDMESLQRAKFVG